ncbi:MAG: NAD(P)H-hydrate dehydratase [Verrucomicrobiaceae bacterium]|nr:MAG: NAD(P)H-hydrate dehydratase [Verrucomicrobiaceae bacterium]
MGAVTIAETLALEADAMRSGWSEEQLLDLAGERLGEAIGRYFSNAGTAVAYLGKGHNAGDTLVALRILRDRYGWEIAIRNAHPVRDCAPLTQEKWRELGFLEPLENSPSPVDTGRPLLLLDGLLGSGAKGPLRETHSKLTAEMNSLRKQGGAVVAAVDLPSGTDPDTGESSPGAVIADITFMIGNAKRGLLSGRAAERAGALAIVPVEPLTAGAAGDMELICPQSLHFGKAPRPFDFHKGDAGRIAILAGSESYAGAAVLAATGALRGGGGLVTLFVPTSIKDLVRAKCPPEVIVRACEDPRELLEVRMDSLVVGCGLGELTAGQAEGLLELLAGIPAPVVIDADALNLIARSGRLEILKVSHVITPHPGEFARLAPELKDAPREDAARRFAERTPATLLLKGSRTIVTRQGQPLYCNSTGSPAMASGGQGDILAGVIGARLASGLPPLEAACLSAWACGRAAEIALNTGGFSEESLLPTDVLNFLGPVFLDWRNARR